MKQNRATSKIIGIALVCLMIGTMFGGFPNAANAAMVPPHIYIVPLDYPTIQAAVDAASPGDTIIVRDGTYTENIDVNTDNLTIQSENGAEKTIVHAANPDDHVFYVTADYVNMSGFTVKGAGYQKAGICLGGSDSDYVEYCNISDNNVLSNNCGIFLHNSLGNKIINNTVNSNNYDGIDLSVSSNNTIANNNVNSNGDDGIGVTLSANNEITNNNVNSNSYCGIRLNDPKNNKITNNTINLNNSYGILIACYNRGYVGYPLNNEILNNNISNNRGAIYFCSSLSNKLYLNNFINNPGGFYFYKSTNTWNSPEEITYSFDGNTCTSYLGNYWSDYTGSDTDGDGIGDTPYSINGDNDNYPLMQPFENYGIGPVDTTPPAAVTDLVVSEVTTDSISLTWTAPGDDGNTGRASYYDLRYSTSLITEANWDSATGVPIPAGHPLPAGYTETMGFSGLLPGTTYYLALKTADEARNWSG